MIKPADDAKNPVRCDRLKTDLCEIVQRPGQDAVHLSANNVPLVEIPEAEKHRKQRVRDEEKAVNENNLVARPVIEQRHVLKDDDDKHEVDQLIDQIGHELPEKISPVRETRFEILSQISGKNAQDMLDFTHCFLSSLHDQLGLGSAPQDEDRDENDRDPNRLESDHLPRAGQPV